jgi:hypothetical protein
MVLLYDTYIDRPPMAGQSRPSQYDRFSNLTKTAYSGELCPHARKRLTHCLNLLVAIARPKVATDLKSGKSFTFKLNFVTLTLPAAQGSVTDRELKTKCLDPFIKSMKRKHGLRSYVWRAERQFNGNLHFHLTTDTYLPHTSIRDEWNRFLSRFHFIDGFVKTHGHSSPNSTDVHSISKIRNIAGYMVKYMSKDSITHLQEVNAKRSALGKSPIDPNSHPFRKVLGQPKWDDPLMGKVWDSSMNLKIKTRCEMPTDSSSNAEIRSIVRDPRTHYVETDHCFLVCLDKGRMQEVLPDRLKRMYTDYLNQIRCWKRPKAVPNMHLVSDTSYVARQRVVQLSLNLSQCPYG